MENQNKWDRRFLRLAREISSWSKDPTTKVGCVIVDVSNRVVGTGYNGFPKLVPDLPEHLENKEEKRLRVIHAEMNAIQFSTGNLNGATLYCTHYPCASCAGIVIQRGIYRIVVPAATSELGTDWKKSVEVARHMFESAKMKFDIYTGDLDGN